ncbi:unknown protein [Seminavis robusta]|uniref:PHD-type domain-containing protein n=1 Tax=Seminavis robusta TaxID=568900 RepID=A0A9N8HL30_9STRA|nr:unknown protein [Seminavis robusta]|eukprot:Sro995_g229110.1 n/a (384) ;mRNA; r:1047-2198
MLMLGPVVGHHDDDQLGEPEVETSRPKDNASAAVNCTAIVPYIAKGLSEPEVETARPEDNEAAVATPSKPAATKRVVTSSGYVKKKRAGSEYARANHRRLKLVTVLPSRKKRKHKSGHDDSDFASSSDSEESAWDPSCEKPKKKPKMKKRLTKLSDSEDKDLDVEEDSNEDLNHFCEEDLCGVCMKHGKLIVCDGGEVCTGCGKAFHVICIRRKAVPEGDWICRACSNNAGISVGIEGHEFAATATARSATPVRATATASTSSAGIEIVHMTTPYEKKTIMAKGKKGKRVPGRVYAMDRPDSFRQQMGAIPRTKVNLLQKYVEGAQRMATPILKSDSFDEKNTSGSYTIARSNESDWPDVMHMAASYREWRWAELNWRHSCDS